MCVGGVGVEEGGEGEVKGRVQQDEYSCPYSLSASTLHKCRRIRNRLHQQCHCQQQQQQQQQLLQPLMSRFFQETMNHSRKKKGERDFNRTSDSKHGLPAACHVVPLVSLSRSRTNLRT